MKRQIPWTIVFLMFSIWVICLGWPFWSWDGKAHEQLATAQDAEDTTFNTMSMDAEILRREHIVDARLHKLPDAMAERLAELRLLDGIFRTYHVTQTERAIKGDGTVHLTWTAPQAQTLQTLYALDNLPVPIMVNTAQLTGKLEGIATDITGHTIGAPPSPVPGTVAAAAPAATTVATPTVTPSPGGST